MKNKETKPETVAMPFFMAHGESVADPRITTWDPLFCSFFFFVCLIALETGSHCISLTVVKLVLWIRLASISPRSTCFCLQNAGIASVCHHACLWDSPRRVLFLPSFLSYTKAKCVQVCVGSGVPLVESEALGERRGHHLGRWSLTVT